MVQKNNTRIVLVLQLDNQLKFESIINWELHNKIQSKKLIHFTFKNKDINFYSYQEKIMNEMKILNSIKLENQIWMSENLNGDEI